MDNKKFDKVRELNAMDGFYKDLIGMRMKEIDHLDGEITFLENKRKAIQKELAGLDVETI